MAEKMCGDEGVGEPPNRGTTQWVSGRAVQRKVRIGSGHTISNSIQNLRIVSRFINPFDLDKSVIDKGN